MCTKTEVEEAYHKGFREGQSVNVELLFLRKVAELINASVHKDEIIKYLLDVER